MPTAGHETAALLGHATSLEAVAHPPETRSGRNNETSTATNDPAFNARLETEVRPFSEWGENVLRAWRGLRASRAAYAPPFFSVEFSAAVNQARGDVLLAVVRQGTQIVAVLPHHRRRRIAYPVGRFLCDAHDMITASPNSVDWMDLLRRLSLRSYDVHALVSSDPSLIRRHRLKTIRSYSAEFGEDSRGYLQRLGRQHKTIGRQPQKTRKLGREVGPVRVELDCRDPGLLDLAIRWKRDQYRRTHILDLFQPEWTRQLLHVLHRSNTAIDESLAHQSTRGLLSVLWAANRPVAAHFGMIECGRLHYWFPAYDVTMAKYSPGTALYRGIVEQASEHGIRTIDMGYGEQPYKRKQTDNITEVAAGCVSRCKFHLTWKSMENAAIDLAKTLPMKSTAKRILRAVRPHAGISRLD